MRGPPPALVEPDHLEILSERYHATPLHEVFGYERGWAVPPPERRAEVEAVMPARAEWRPTVIESGSVPGERGRWRPGSGAQR